MNMTPLSRANQRSDEDLRAFAVAVQTELGLTQEEIADVLHCDQSLVHQMISYGGQRRLPVAFIPLLKGPERVQAFQFELIKWQAKGSNVVVTLRTEEMKVDGSLDDEIAGIVKAIGGVQSVLELNPGKRVAIDALLLKVKQLVHQMEEEINQGATS